MICPNCGGICNTAESCRYCKLTTVLHLQKCPNCGAGSPVFDRYECSFEDGGCGYPDQTKMQLRKEIGPVNLVLRADYRLYDL